MITILGATASGKTKLAVSVAAKINGAVISADSRQVFCGMDIGTGKDLHEYQLAGGGKIPYHLIDIRHVGEEYSAFDFVQDAKKAEETILKEQQIPILCGGTGFYIESFFTNNLIEVPVNDLLRSQWSQKTNAELIEQLTSFRKLHNQTDTEDRSRLMRALEIAIYQNEHRNLSTKTAKPLIFGIDCPRKTIMNRIELRLKERLENGMMEEVEKLQNQVGSKRLQQYGLEYRYVSQYLTGELAYNEMVLQLNIAIRQFAKRQMTWFRRMERNGFPICWLPFENGTDANAETICSEMQKIENKSNISLASQHS